MKADPELMAHLARLDRLKINDVEKPYPFTQEESAVAVAILDELRSPSPSRVRAELASYCHEGCQVDQCGEQGHGSACWSGAAGLLAIPCCGAWSASICSHSVMAATEYEAIRQLAVYVSDEVKRGRLGC